MRKDVNTWFFVIVLLVVLYLAVLVAKPYLSYIILSVVIAYTTRPLYRYIDSRLKKPWLSSAIMLLLVFLVLFIPSMFFLRSLTTQGTRIISSLDLATVEQVNTFFLEKFGVDLDMASFLSTGVAKTREFLINEGVSVISGVVDIFIGIVIMFFVLFYLFRDGEKIYRTIVDVLPLRPAHKRVLFGEMEIVTNAVIYGQLVIAIIQGVLGGVAFAIFGIQGAVFWGFVIAVVSFLPVLGTLMIYIPAGLLQLLQQHYVAGIGVIIYGLIVNANVDSVFRPLIISEKSRLNAALILIGVIGGLKVFGFMGFVVGPLVLAVFIALLQVVRQDFKPSEALAKAVEQEGGLIIPLKPRPADEHRIVDKAPRRTQRAREAIRRK